MKAVIALLVVVLALAYSEAAPSEVDKRFLLEDIKHLGDVISGAFHAAWDKSKDAFHKVTDLIPFDEAVNALIPLIHSGMTVSACTATCTGAAATVLGPAAVLASTICA